MANNNAVDVEEFDELEAMLSGMQDDVVEAEAVDTVEAEDATADIDLDELSEDLEEAEKAVDTIQLQAPIASNKVAQDESEATEEPVKKAKKKTSSLRFSSSDCLKSYGHKLFSEAKPLLLVLDDEDKKAEDATIDNLSSLEAIKPVKVREKLANALAWIADGKTLSKYTRATLQLMKDKGEASKADVTNHLLDQGVNLGTASSQSGQMTHILLGLKVATLVGGKFVANPDSIVLQMIEESKPAEESKAA